MFSSDPDIVGVDFSGASDAGKHIWVTEATADGDELLVERCYSVEEATGSVDRQSALEELVTAINDSGDCSVGLDFPFGIPEVVTEAETWSGTLDWICDQTDPDSFHEACKEKYAGSGGDGKYGSRVTEARQNVGGLCSYGWRIRMQTFYGVSEVLRKLQGKASFPPMEPTESRTKIVETYPAATFESIRANRTGYKAKRYADHERRFQNVESLKSEGVVFANRDACRFAQCDDNALDSVAAAFATHRSSAEVESNTKAYRTEGHIYV